MEVGTKLAWAALALIHAAPAAVVFRPALLERLYQVAPQGDLGVLLVHRGALFLAIVAGCLYAAFEPDARRGMTLVVAISVVSFLILYARAGFPAGALRPIAVGDVVALAPLMWLAIAAWRA
jgi:hypothetical protein